MGDKRLRMIEQEQWVDWKDGSDKLANPGKKFYLELAVRAFATGKN